MFYGLLTLSLLKQQPNVVYLDSIDLSAMTIGWGDVQKNRSVGGHSLSIGGRTFEHGVGTHAHSEVTINLAGNATKFSAWVGVDDEAAANGSVRFVIYVNDKRVANSGVMHAKSPAKNLSVDLTGAKRIRLVADEDGDIDNDHADWADAQFEVVDPSKRLVTLTLAKEPTMEIAHVDLSKTEIHGARAVGCTPGRDFIFRIPATGDGPLTYRVSGLPRGIALVKGTGILRGRAPAAGTYPLRVTVSGPNGRDSRTITIISGDHKLAQTPPMGWNSWNVWGLTVTADKIRAAADAFISTHLADFGYTYVNIDDGWEAENRDAEGNIMTNQKFGDMASLATYVHNDGLRLGIYSSPGPKTCGGYTASYQHEKQDAMSYANWGVDYLKYDWCSYGNAPHAAGLAGYELPYKVMRAALDEARRDIVYSLCQYGMGDVYKWGHSDVGGNCWRTTGDINDSWSSMSGIGFSHSERSTYVKPGGWNDPDMLVVGKLGWGDHPHPTGLTGNEQITHISLWSLLAAPLLIGCDLTQLDQFTKDILMNPEMIEIDQDPLGKAATRRFQDGDLEVWARPLWDGSYAVGLFNRGYEHAPIHTSWARDLEGLKGNLHIRNVWQRKDAGRSSEGFTADVPAHGAVVIRVKR
ncbi:MAG TPA: NPCBM/NEW2 domain-containing protein [Fimbriimonas sp.]|nr:NPCBM/NEW2 domain-containing protein [Fimbriimonas sp.]